MRRDGVYVLCVWRWIVDCVYLFVCVGNIGVLFCCFFFKQKTAYEMLRSLVGSEMCIRDRFLLVLAPVFFGKLSFTALEGVLPFMGPGAAERDLSLIHI